MIKGKYLHFLHAYAGALLGRLSQTQLCDMFVLREQAANGIWTFAETILFE